MFCRALIATALVSLLLLDRAHAESLELVTGVEAQPVVAQTKRLVEAFEFIGSPFSADEKSRLAAAYEATSFAFSGDPSMRDAKHFSSAMSRLLRF